MYRRIGVDEVGRGPVAGPVAVGVVAVPPSFEWSQLPPVKDSKQMTARARERVYARVHEVPDIQYAVSFVSAQSIDAYGIVPAITSALSEALSRVAHNPALCEVLLDGGLRAPALFTHQTTIIRGDASEPVIALASVLAKVERDRYMVALGAQYPLYGFEKHMGYGTKAHYQALATHGLSPEHRRTFLKKIAKV